MNTQHASDLERLTLRLVPSRVPFARGLAQRYARRRQHRRRIETQLALFRAVVDQYAPGVDEFGVPEPAAMATAQAARTAEPDAYEWKRRRAVGRGEPVPAPHGAHLEAMERQDRATFSVVRALRHQFRLTTEYVAAQVRASPWLPEDAIRAARALRTDSATVRTAAESAGAAAAVGAVLGAAGPIAQGASVTAKLVVVPAATDAAKAGSKELLKGPLRSAGPVLQPGAHAAATVKRAAEAMDVLLIHSGEAIARAWASGERMDLAVLAAMLRGIAEVERAVDAWGGRERPMYVDAPEFQPLPTLAVDGATRWRAVHLLTNADVGFQLAHHEISVDRDWRGGRDWTRYVERLGVLLYDPAAESSVLRRLESLRVGEPESGLRPLLRHPNPDIRRRVRDGIGHDR